MKFLYNLNASELAASRTFLTGISFRLISVVVAFVSVPLLLNYLGSEVFGALNTLIVLFFYLNQSSLGVNFSLQTEFPNLKKNETVLRQAFTSVLIFNAFIALFLFLLAAVFSYSNFFISKFSAFSHNASLNIDLNTWRGIFLLIVGIITIELPLDVGVRFVSAAHKKYITHIALSVASFVSLLLTIYFVQARWQITWIIFAQFGISTLAFMYINCKAFQIPEIQAIRKISLRDFDFSALKNLLPTGLRYSGIQLLTVLMFWSDNIFIAHASGFEQVTQYALASKVNTLLSMPAVVFSSAIFSMFNEAMIHENKSLLDKMRKQNLWLISVYSGIVLLFVFLGVNFFTQIWLQKPNFWNTEWKCIIALQTVFYCFYIYCVEMLVSAPLIKRGTRLFIPVMLIAFAAKFLGLYFGGILGLVVLPIIILTFGYVIPALKLIN